MTTEVLESLLEGGAETPSIDYKQSCPWDITCFVKDILAMSNVQDGGIIIIGVKEDNEGGFLREGVSDENKDTYVIDIMKDQVSGFADPYVGFEVDFPVDSDYKNYVVIRVFPFEELPVICKKEGADVHAGRIYYRNRNRRVESAPVSNSYDMRSIIQLAAVKMMRGFLDLGLSADATDMQRFEEELQGL